MGKQKRHRYHRAAPVHRNPNGNWCHCPFGDPRKEKFVSRHDLEAVGSVTSMWHEASKADWLLERKDVQEEPLYKQFVEKLQHRYPEHDPLYPWLLREYKKGRVRDQEPSNLHVSPGFTNKDGFYVGTLEPDHLDSITDWMKYMKQAKKGVDIMQHEVGPALHEADKNDEGGETVHNFTGDAEGNPHGYYDDWTMKRLRNKRDMRKEGQRMDHCVGSNGQGYLEKNDEGKGAYYSLRTPNNEPVATLEMTPHKEHYYMCPGCGKPAFGQPRTPEAHAEALAPGGKGWTASIHCEHCDTPLASQPTTQFGLPRSDTSGDPMPATPRKGVKQFPVKINYKKPTVDHMNTDQLFGHSDRKLEEDHEALVNAWLGKHGHSYMHSDGDEDYEDEDEEEEYEPWWDSEYSIDPAENVEDFINQHVHGDHDSYSPSEYDRAMEDANEHGFEGPNLYVPEPDVDAIWEDHKDRNANSYSHDGRRLDPHEIADMFKYSEDHGFGELWREKADTWLNDEYNNYLDPYGQQAGPGLIPGSPGIRDRQVKHRGPLGVEPTQPGAHFPSSYPGDELFAKNLQYHLDKYRDPQEQHRGERGQASPYMHPYQMKYRYPHVAPPESPPRGRRDEIPIAERTGPDLARPPGRPMSESIDLPYGRDTDFSNTQYPRGDAVHMPDVPRAQYPNPTMNSYDAWQDNEGFQPHRPSGPGDAFGEPNIRMHQPPLPGTGGFDPTDHAQWKEGEQQGELYPSYWYRTQNGMTRHAELPPELYPPGSLMYSTLQRGSVMSPGVHPDDAPGPEQTTPLWENGSFKPDGTPYHNPQQPGQYMFTQINSQPPGDYGMPPETSWIAKTAGPWTDYEDTQKNSPEPHAGIPQQNGRVVETNVSRYNPLPNFDWRLPVAYHRGEDRLYVGQPAMDHQEMMQHMGKPSPWNRGMPAHDMMPGFIDLTNHLGAGGLQWFTSGAQIPNEDQLHDWVESRYGVRHTNDTNQLTDADWISSARKVAWSGEIEPTPLGGYEPSRPAVSDVEREEYDRRGPLLWAGPQSRQPGKAFLDEFGQLHTWNEDHDSPNWQHSDQADMRGVEHDLDTAIYLNPGGAVKDNYGLATYAPEKTDALYAELQKHHPGTTWPAKDTGDKGEFGDEDLWHDSSYHPRQDDEWVAGDESDFSVVVPEARWHA